MDRRSVRRFDSRTTGTAKAMEKDTPEIGTDHAPSSKTSCLDRCDNLEEA
ncbi:hypothetical protein KFZ58_06085 [Virgibacillus sp. NKC19-16]|nr:hypothetical protein [Virgibacillus sp. NKC19-16]UJL47449.1 hypothetical protein KFZ58_06085 [Virgibacillus sp. NKC19-16]